MGATPTPATISKTQNPKHSKLEVRRLSNSGFEFVSNFGFRISDFYREVIRLPACKSGVIKYVSEETNWSITSTSHHFGLVAQPAERPVVCGRVEGATPFGSANFEHSYRRTLPGLVSCVSAALMKQPSGLSARSVAANALGLGPRDRRCNSCRADHF